MLPSSVCTGSFFSSLASSSISCSFNYTTSSPTPVSASLSRCRPYPRPCILSPASFHSSPRLSFSSPAGHIPANGILPHATPATISPRSNKLKATASRKSFKDSLKTRKVSPGRGMGQSQLVSDGDSGGGRTPVRRDVDPNEAVRMYEDLGKYKCWVKIEGIDIDALHKEVGAMMKSPEIGALAVGRFLGATYRRWFFRHSTWFAAFHSMEDARRGVDAINGKKIGLKSLKAELLSEKNRDTCFAAVEPRHFLVVANVHKNAISRLLNFAKATRYRVLHPEYLEDEGHTFLRHPDWSLIGGEGEFQKVTTDRLKKEWEAELAAGEATHPRIYAEANERVRVRREEVRVGLFFDNELEKYEAMAKFHSLKFDGVRCHCFSLQ